VNHDEKRLARALAEMALGPEEKKRRAQAAKLRKALRPAAEEDEPAVPLLDRADWDHYQELEVGPSRRRRPKPPAAPAVASEVPVATAARPGLVLSTAQNLAWVAIDAAEVLCRLTGAVAVRQQTELAVGDEVMVETRGDVEVVVAVAPRRSRLSRPDPLLAARERVIAANVDTVAIVEPAPLRLGLVDRLILAVGQGGARPLVVASKVDRLDTVGRDELATQAAAYDLLGVAVVSCSTRSGEGLDALRVALAGGLAVLVGQSGVGKSSLINALDPELASRGEVATQATREHDGKGRHTTSASRLHRLAGDVRIIDTPGVRQFGLWELDVDAVLGFFPEVAALETRCRYRDCRHADEPGCALPDAVAAGEVSAARLALFRRMVAAVGRA
jgi:ribosome biogenesis GTPase